MTQMSLSTNQKQIHRHRDRICGCQGAGGQMNLGLADANPKMNLGLADANYYI